MVHSSRRRCSASRISLGATLVSLVLAQLGVALPVPATWMGVKSEATPLPTRSQVDRRHWCGYHDPRLAADQIERHGGSRPGRLPLRCAPRHHLPASHPVAGTAGQVVAAPLQRLIAE
jgi:hypothetical protein